MHVTAGRDVQRLHVFAVPLWGRDKKLDGRWIFEGDHRCLAGLHGDQRTERAVVVAASWCNTLDRFEGIVAESGRSGVCKRDGVVVVGAVKVTSTVIAAIALDLGVVMLVCAPANGTNDCAGGDLGGRGGAKHGVLGALEPANELDHLVHVEKAIILEELQEGKEGLLPFGACFSKRLYPMWAIVVVEDGIVLACVSSEVEYSHRLIAWVGSVG